MKTSKIKLSLTTMAVLLLAGCTYGSKVALNGESYAPVPVEHVAVLMQPPDRAYKVIGMVTSKGAHLASDEAVYNKLKTEAADLGADAIIVQSEGQEPRWYVPPTADTSGSAISSGNVTTFDSTTTYNPGGVITGIVVRAEAIKYQ
jgi:hypothetical protein